MDTHKQHVEDLAVRHRAKDALRQLMAAGPLATEAVRRGLHHPDPAVRVGCCVVLDHYLDEAALPDLIANLDHLDEEVRKWALHALACARCKEGECRPGEDEVLPIALKMLVEDGSAAVRDQAIRLVFPLAHQRPEVLAAIEQARDNDPSPRVRKQAGLRAPGGVMFLRSSPARPLLKKSNARSHLRAG